MKMSLGFRLISALIASHIYTIIYTGLLGKGTKQNYRDDHSMLNHLLVE